jgi:hypothetical protein
MNAELYDRMLGQLKLSGYQERSWKSYIRAVRQLQNFHSKPLAEITEEDRQQYWVYRQQLRLLPCTYFLATFTVHEELRALIRN